MEKELREQTAFETGGIPTPAGQEHMGATDGLAGAVEGIMDNIEASFADGKPDAKSAEKRKNS
ncbi:hypothetical protein [Paenibacillus sp.]|uniref:hypothetical protein n=1 Tax=Paenibacillus sp. TaxID=58172 RepID=UPI002D3DCB58|nr:hypothetical protein [Paenibacillus sp.]HZG88207.1 hypothetical protein [Paenibacillus sp.]